MVWQGVAAAQSFGELPFALFDAVAASEEEAAEQQFHANAERSVALARRKAGR